MSDNQSMKTNLITFIGDFSKIAAIRFIKGEEGFSKSFCFTILVDTYCSFATISSYIGHSVGLQIDINNDKRYIHGIIAEIEQGSIDEDFDARKSDKTNFTGTEYTIKLESKLILLQKNLTCHVHSAKKIMDVVYDILKKNNIPYDASRLSEDTSIPKARVQYNQSDYDFISELLQSIGVFYCFHHFEDKHRIVFYDNISQLKDLKDKNYTLFKVYDEHSISELRQRQTLVPSSVKINGYHFENNAAFSPEFPITLKTQKNIKICHYTDSFLDNLEQLNNQIKFRSGQFSSVSTIGKIVSSSPSIGLGDRFKINSHNYAKELEIEYYISELNLKARNCVFTPVNDFSMFTDCIFDAELTIHPYTNGACYYPPFKVSRQLISGSISAFVAGSEKEDINTDEYGRIQIRFLWQQEKYGSEYSKLDYCWARVTQAWSGRNMGSQFIPRVGSEVIVSFLNGDPNYPIITGCVFNGNYKPAFNLDDFKNKTCSGIISHNNDQSSKAAGHQLCFQDQKGEEFVLLQSQKDLLLKAEKDATLTISNGDYTVTVEKGKITIHCAEEMHICSKEQITLSVEDSKINITNKEIKITAPIVAISAIKEATLSAEAKVGISAGVEAEMSARDIVNIHGLEIKLN